MHTQHSNSSIRSFPQRVARAAFTLVEMLVVLAVMGLITAAVAPQVFGTLVATRLSSAGQTMVGAISLAHELAVSGGQEVELRFYRYEIEDEPDSDQAFRAIVMVKPSDDPTVSGQQIGEIIRCPAGIIMGDTQALSPILHSSDLKSQNDEEKFIRSTKATYKSFRFRPDGTSTLSMAAQDCYFTLAEERLIAKSSEVPANFYAVQVDPQSGRTETFRP
jgi:uncharacterized protein (TIGR02596 family)